MAKPAKVLVYRHAAVTRLTHWINVLALTLLLMSGLNIFGAHPALYWGQKSAFAHPWISGGAEQQGAKMQGVTWIGGAKFNTTGVLGYSGKPGAEEQVAFPAWATVPSARDLADARHWHFFFAWLFVINGLVYWLVGLVGGHIRKDLLPTKRDVAAKNVWHEVVTHARLKFPKGEEALCMSPGFNAATPWLVEFFGGRQSARTIHFITAFAIVGFILLHLFMVVASGTWNNIRSMITGRYAIVPHPGDKAGAGDKA
jgi:thiosulfate reductase cytochrome b subunit